MICSCPLYLLRCTLLDCTSYEATDKHLSIRSCCASCQATPGLWGSFLLFCLYLVCFVDFSCHLFCLPFMFFFKFFSRVCTPPVERNPNGARRSASIDCGQSRNAHVYSDTSGKRPSRLVSGKVWARIQYPCTYRKSRCRIIASFTLLPPSIRRLRRPGTRNPLYVQLTSDRSYVNVNISAMPIIRVCVANVM